MINVSEQYDFVHVHVSKSSPVGHRSRPICMELYSGQNCQEVIRRKLSIWFNDIRFNWRIFNVGIVAYLNLTDTIVVFFTVT